MIFFLLVSGFLFLYKGMCSKFITLSGKYKGKFFELAYYGVDFERPAK